MAAKLARSRRRSSGSPAIPESGTGTTAHPGLVPIGCSAGCAQFPPLHDPLAPLRRGFFAPGRRASARLANRSAPIMET